MDQVIKKKEEGYQRNYPLYGTTRLRKYTLSRIKRYGRYGQSIDEVVTKLLDGLENKKTRDEEKSW